MTSINSTLDHITEDISIHGPYIHPMFPNIATINYSTCDVSDESNAICTESFLCFSITCYVC